MDFQNKLKELKNGAGTHSPSIQTILEVLPHLKIKIDACFLSNPYATELFLEYFKKELLDTGKINRVLEFYPSQSKEIAKLLGNHLQINPLKIFVSNGAIEIMQAIIHKYVTGKIIVNIPTFSPYYEFVLNENDVVFYKLKKDNNFNLNVSEYIDFVKKEKPQSIVLINPNNPDGGYIKTEDVKKIIESLSEVENIIIDESFIHFAHENAQMELVSVVPFAENFDNVTIIKSMSKDFGIAGLRCGYAILKESRVKELTQKGYLWNLNGLAEYFFRLYVRQDFRSNYEIVRKKYITEALSFMERLQQLEGIKVYPSKANFALIELLNGKTTSEITEILLIDYGIYVRNTDDKIGLEGHFIRVASRSKKENEFIFEALKEILDA